ncbi:MAG: hypothetical protein KH452_02135 [Clostridiales bacterium]|nr:hypothetical protein [Clostridiales bacterium]
MEQNVNVFWGSRRPTFLSVTGMITEMQMVSANGSRYGGCSQMITVENEEGGITNFFVNKDTYVVDFATLSEGMPVTAFYNGNLPAPLIYPPQFIAAVVAPQMPNQMVAVAFFNNMLTASDQSLRLNLGPNTEVVTPNNQIFMGNPGGHTLVVLYSETTRSIPPQTTPEKVIVLCGM